MSPRDASNNPRANNTHGARLHDESIYTYHSTPGKTSMGDEISPIAKNLFDRKRELCKAIYALCGTLNHAIALKESFVLERVHIFVNTLHTWCHSGNTDIESLKRAFDKPLSEMRLFSNDMFPPVHFPQDEFKAHFGRLCRSLMLPLSLGDLERLDPNVPTPGRKTGYLFHKSKSGEWSREYFYIQPNGMLMQWSKGKHIHVANLKQTLLRVVRDDKRDFVFEICSIEVYLMESILQATTKEDFEEWKAALFFWHPPDDDIPQIDKLKIATPSSPNDINRLSSKHYIAMIETLVASPTPPQHWTSARAACEFVKAKDVSRVSCGDQRGPIYVRYYSFLRSKPMSTQNKLATWKRITCHIRSNGHLVQYNEGDSEKPFETIPLADTLRTHIWALDSSLFSKKHCFSIKTSNDVNYYTVSTKRSSSDEETFNTWLYILKSYAKPEVFGVTELLEYRLYRTFRISVNDCRRLPKDLEVYCEIMLDDQKRAKTSTRMKVIKNSDQEIPFWRDSFEFADLAPFTKGITINVIQAKGSKAIPYGRTHIPVRNNDESDEGWYPILRVNDRTRSTEHPGDLRLKLKYEEQIVLPLANYYELLEENNVISRLAEFVPDLEGFAKNVLRILEGRDLAIPWLNSLIDEEIAEADPTQVNTLFRGNTLLTKALDAYMRLMGTEYLDDTLGDILRGICRKKIACEVDPSKIDKKDDIDAQWKTLMFHTRTCWRAVTESVPRFPKQLRRVFSHLQQRLTEKFSNVEPTNSSNPDTELVTQARYTGVSGFVFLRLICPAILGPRLFHIVKDQICTEDTSSPSSGIDSGSNSVNSLPSHVSHSPASTSSSIFKSQAKAGDNRSTISTGYGGGILAMAPMPSSGSQIRTSRSSGKDNVQPPEGTIGSEILERNQDMPHLPHLIDLGRELALFTKTVARVIDSCPELYEELFPVESSDAEHEAHESDQQSYMEHGGEDDDILHVVARACLFLLNTVKDRVDLSVEFERDERQRALASNGNGKALIGMENISGLPGYPKGKTSREASRDGDELIVVYENYDSNEHDGESFDGCVHNGYDSDDGSFGRRSAHNVI
ncbi:hypothetical protein BGX21_001929 [Mortierella sp. AD011]|nr:hypothetical protein BGX21_001929 [Mortierella sp. AD011]